MIEETKNEYVLALLKVINRFGNELVTVYEFQYPNEGSTYFMVRSTAGSALVFDYFNEVFSYLVHLLREATQDL